MTSEEKLAKIMAMSAIRKVLADMKGTVDFHDMTVMFENQDPYDLSGGEAEAFFRMRQVLRRNDDATLETDMRECDSFKEVLSVQFDKVLADLRLALAG